MAFEIHLYGIFHLTESNFMLFETGFEQLSDMIRIVAMLCLPDLCLNITRCYKFVISVLSVRTPAFYKINTCTVLKFVPFPFLIFRTISVRWHISSRVGEYNFCFVILFAVIIKTEWHHSSFKNIPSLLNRSLFGKFLGIIIIIILISKQQI